MEGALAVRLVSNRRQCKGRSEINKVRVAVKEGVQRALDSLGVEYI